MLSPEQKLLPHSLSETFDMIIIAPLYSCLNIFPNCFSFLFSSPFLSPHFSVLFSSHFLPHLSPFGLPSIFLIFPPSLPFSPHLTFPSTFLQSYDSFFPPTSFYRISPLPSCTPFSSPSSTFYSLDRYRFSEPKSN